MAKEALKGIGGWLLVFVICTAISVLYGIFSIISLLTVLISSGLISNIFAIISILMALIPLSLLLINGILILRKYEKAIKFTIFTLIFNFVWFLVEMGFMIIAGLNTPAEIWPYLTMNLSWALIWLVYFKKSKRVKNTLIK
jgi:hypothetical protein